MEVYVFDTGMDTLGVVDNITSLIWTRRYWEAGEFKLLVPFTEAHAALLTKNRLAMPRAGREAAQISYIHISKDLQGKEQIEVQGRFITAWLAKRVVRKQIIATDNTQNILCRLVNENAGSNAEAARKFPNFAVEASASLGSGVIQYTSAEYAQLLDACEDAAKAAKLGFQIRTDPQTGQHRFRVYAGRDLTYGNMDGNAPRVFSQEFDNVLEQEYTNSTENVKSTIYVIGEAVEGQQRAIVEVGTAAGILRDEVYHDAGDIKQTYKDANDNDVTLTTQQYNAALAQRGNAEMANHTESLAFSSKINPASTLIFGEHFDVGDRVTCKDRRWGLTIDVRITQAQITYEKGKPGEIEITFGESLPTRMDKILKTK